MHVVASTLGGSALHITVNLANFAIGAHVSAALEVKENNAVGVSADRRCVIAPACIGSRANDELT